MSAASLVRLWVRVTSFDTPSSFVAGLLKTQGVDPGVVASEEIASWGRGRPDTRRRVILEEGIDPTLGIDWWPSSRTTWCRVSAASLVRLWLWVTSFDTPSSFVAGLLKTQGVDPGVIAYEKTANRGG